MTKRSTWTKSFGERRSGVRVRVYEARPGGTLMRSVWNASTGKEDRKSLGHKDKALAERQAYELLAQLVADEEAVEKGTLTLAQLQRLYLESPAFAEKKERTRQEDARRMERVVRFLGPSREVQTLTDSDVRRFIAARRKGDPKLLGVKPGVVVRDRSLEADLVAIHTMLNWGVKERGRDGRPLLSENPLRGTSIPREKNQIQPVVTHDVFERLYTVAEQVTPLLPLAILLAEATGRRLSAIRQLQWADIDLEAGTIRWRADTDKKGYERVYPMSDFLRAELAARRRANPAIGTAWLFPAPRNPAKPCDRHLLDDWLRKAYKLAGLTPPKGGMWHQFRRKWATERKHHPLKDVAKAGGWADLRSVERYTQTDEDTIRTVILNPTHRLAAGAM